MDIKQLSSGRNPGGIKGFPDDITGMFVATYILLLFWILWVLLKYIFNMFSPAYKEMYAPGPEGMQGMSSYQQWRMQRQMGGAKGGGIMGLFQTRQSPMPAPPPMANAPQMQQQAQQQQQPQAGFPMGPGGPGGPGAQGGFGGKGAYNDGTQGINSHIGTPYDSKPSVGLSRGADVFWRGWLLLLGGTVLNALSFDPTPSANALGWIFMACIIIWAFLTTLFNSRWIPLILGLIAYPIIIAIYAVGFLISD
ncbi:hypothetical protein MIR68_001803 [Amoeboaphelidium protococcarum]|nr:hypothetical protein MIR68_001803 [Amoeboaphelidium protococcarum]